MLNVAGMISNSLANGPKLRCVLFLQGCPHHCIGCQNEHTWEFGQGRDMSTDEIIANIEDEIPLIEGLTISGGEPFAQAEELYNLLLELAIKQPNLNIWVYTGYKIEELIAEDDENIKGILSLVNVIVDGKFERNQMFCALKYTGSRNQRIIYLNKGQIDKIVKVEE